MEEELAHHWVQLCGRTGHENREEDEGHRLLEGNAATAVSRDVPLVTAPFYRACGKVNLLCVSSTVHPVQKL